MYGSDSILGLASIHSYYEKSIDSLNDKTLFEIDSNNYDDELTFEKAQFFSGGHDAGNANTGEVYVDR